MNACEITASVTAVANILAKNLNEDELSLLGTIFSQLGDTIETIMAQRAFCQNRKENICCK